MDSYESLLKKYEEMLILSSIQGVLYWDQNTYMPSAGLNTRTRQFGYLSRKLHAMWTSNELGTLVNQCLKDESLDDLQRRNVELLDRAYRLRTQLSEELVGKLALQSNKTLEVWKKAKSRKDFSIVQPDMELLFELYVERGECIGNLLGISDPYDALLAERDPGVTRQNITGLFGEFREFLVPFVARCLETDIEFNTDVLRRRVPRAQQVQLVNEVADFLEYDTHGESFRGRIDEVEHPLTIGCGEGDTRITVKYHEEDVLRAVLAGAHECGHALDSLQRNPEWVGQPMKYVGFPGFGESQSRIVENHVGRSREFWSYFYPIFQRTATDVFDDVPLDTFYAAMNCVKPGPSRLGADELTYALHIIIRFELEQDMFSRRISIKDLPFAWNEKYENYLGIEVENDTVGVMQDLHWYSQYWGYFHGYAMGDLIASQISEKITDAMPDWRAQIAQGSFSNMRQWLADNVHSLGARYDPLDTVKHITGKPLSVKPHVGYLEKKYSEIYGL